MKGLDLRINFVGDWKLVIGEIKMFRVGIIKENGTPEAQNFKTKKEAEDYLLSLMEKEQLRQARIKDLDSGVEEIII